MISPDHQIHFNWPRRFANIAQILGVEHLQETRVITVGIARLLVDLLEKAIGERTDITLVANIADENAVAEFVERHQADVVIFSLAADRLTEICGPLLRACPNLVAISFADRDRLLLHCELRPQVFESGEASMDGLIDMIQRLVRQHA